MQSWKYTGKSDVKLQLIPAMETRNMLDTAIPGDAISTTTLLLRLTWKWRIQPAWLLYGNWADAFNEETGAWKLQQTNSLCLLNKLSSYKNSPEHFSIISISYVPEVLRIPQVCHVLLWFMLYVINHHRMRVDHLCEGSFFIGMYIKLFIWALANLWFEKVDSNTGGLYSICLEHLGLQRYY